MSSGHTASSLRCPTNAIIIVFPEQMVRNETEVLSLLGKAVE